MVQFIQELYSVYLWKYVQIHRNASEKKSSVQGEARRDSVSLDTQTGDHYAYSEVSFPLPGVRCKIVLIRTSSEDTEKCNIF